MFGKGNLSCAGSAGCCCIVAFKPTLVYEALLAESAHLELQLCTTRRYVPHAPRYLLLATAVVGMVWLQEERGGRGLEGVGDQQPRVPTSR